MATDPYALQAQNNAQLTRVALATFDAQVPDPANDPNSTQADRLEYLKQRRTLTNQISTADGQVDFIASQQQNPNGLTPATIAAIDAPSPVVAQTTADTSATALSTALANPATPPDQITALQTQAINADLANQQAQQAQSDISNQITTANIQAAADASASQTTTNSQGITITPLQSPTQFAAAAGATPTTTASNADQRIRIRPKSGISNLIYGTQPGATTPLNSSATKLGVNNYNSIMGILSETNGVVFQYTPAITQVHEANYSTMDTVHANQNYYVYTNTPALKIQISGKFTAQNVREAQYQLAAAHFFRTVTKMRFGDSDSNRGLPPPVLLLSGYGDYMYNDLPVIITSFTEELSDNVDYVQVTVNAGTVWVPTVTTFTVSCVVQLTAKQQRTFDWNQFASGALMKKKGWL